jgi:acyl carrier protein
LILDPGFFHALRDHLPQVTAVNIELKRGSYVNELSKFRYDVVLQVGTSEPPDAASGRALHWRHELLTVTKLRHLLEEDKPTALRIEHVPSARITPELQLLHLMETRGDSTIDELRQSVEQQPFADAVQPDELWQLGEELLYHVQIEWSDDGGADGNMTVVFRRVDDGVALPIFTGGRRRDAGRPLSDYANEPTRTIWSNEFGSELRTWLKRKLPEYMIPETIVTLETLPLTGNGKIDFAALPVPGHGSTERWRDYVAPRNETEETLAHLFAEILDLEKVGVHDNFFELGGHSLMATQLISRMRKILDVDIALRVLFEAPTVSALAEHINMIRWISQPRLESEMINREQISFDVSG